MTFTANLYPYQRQAFDAFMERGSLLLAFDMGLGKTATAIAVAEELLETREVRRVLIVVAASLKLQWARSLARFTDLRQVQALVKGEKITIPARDACVIIDGTPEHREKQYREAQGTSVEYVITGYEQVVSDFRSIRRLGCGLVILDEASAVKTPGTKRTGAVKRHLRVPYRLALTGTPVENRPEEVFSIMQWVDETVLGRHDHFDKAYITRNAWGAVEGYKNLDILHERLSAGMVRKTREDPDVAPFMPGVDTEVWRVPVDPETMTAYRVMAGDLLRAYDEVDLTGSAFNVDAHYGGVKGDRRGDKTGLGKLMGIHGCMEMLLAHPSLLERSARLYAETDDRGSRYAAETVMPSIPLPGTSPKLDYYARRCAEILTRDPGAKILTFTWYKSMLPLMAERLTASGFGVTLYDGDMSVREKEASVQRFKTRPEVRVFLSSHAGAYGTDLPEANWLINYDLAWSAGKAAQINARHVRASSEFDRVRVVSMVMAGTIEERKLSSQGFKNSLASRAVDGRGGADLRSDVESLRQHVSDLLESP